MTTILGGSLGFSINQLSKSKSFKAQQ